MVGKGLAGIGGGAFGLLLAIRIADGSYAALVQGWYRPVLIGTALVLLVLAAVVSYQVMRSNGRWKLQMQPRAVVMVALAAIPLALGFAYEPKPLGSASLETLQDGGRSSLEFSSTAMGSDPSQRNIYQWAFEFANTEPSELLGESVNVMGFVYHASDQPDGTFQVARFVVACCVADARGYMLPIRWNGADSLRNDTWVEVTGRIGTAPDGSLVVMADTVEQIEAPANPYIYP